MKVYISGREVDVKPGEAFVSGGKVFSVCGRCNRILKRRNVTGFLHVCAPPQRNPSLDYQERLWRESGGNES